MIPTTTPVYKTSDIFRTFFSGKEFHCRICQGGFKMELKDEASVKCYLTSGSLGVLNALMQWTCPNCKNDNYDTRPTNK